MSNIKHLEHFTETLSVFDLSKITYSYIFIYYVLNKNYPRLRIALCDYGISMELIDFSKKNISFLKFTKYLISSYKQMLKKYSTEE
jgi:hypothetical protein